MTNTEPTNAHAIAMVRAAAAVTSVFIAAFLLVWSWFAFRVVENLVEKLQTYRMVSGEGRVTQVDRRHDSSPRSHGRDLFNVHYTYDVAGKNYQDVFTEQNLGTAMHYKSQSAVQVFHDPGQPARSTLRQGPEIEDYLGLIVISGGAVALGHWLRHCWRVATSYDIK